MLSRVGAKRNVLRSVRYFSEAVSANQNPTGAGGASASSREDPAGIKEEPIGRRPYRCQRPSHNRVFRWGVGNKFRSTNEGRYSPVHHERPREFTIRDDYYESDNNAIQWEPLNEAWEVFWYENGKLNAKPFPVKKFGIEASKVEAAKFYDELVETKRIQPRESMAVADKSGQDGVFFDERTVSWVSLHYKNGKPACRTYSAAVYGHDGAKVLALNDRQTYMGQFDNILQE